MRRLGCLVLLTATTGCIGYTPAWDGAPRLPDADSNGEQAAARGPSDPWQRLARIENQWRDAAINFSGGHGDGLDKVRYPTTAQLRLAWEYVEVGREFAQRQETGPAVRAYWAAIALVRRTFASRPDRENVRSAAYAGLAEIAESRKQPTYASLLRLCEHLVDAYLASDQAKDDRNAFRDELDKLRSAEQEAKSEESAATWAMVLGSVNAGLKQAQGQLSHDAAMQADAQSDMKTTQDKYTASEQAYSHALSDIGQGASDFEAVASDDVSEIEAGKSFVGLEADFKLSAAASLAPYLPYLRSFGKRHPEVSVAIEGLGDDTPKDERAAKVKALARALVAIEVQTAKCERRGLKCAEPPPPAPPPPVASAPATPAASASASASAPPLPPAPAATAGPAPAPSPASNTAPARAKGAK